MSDRRLIDAERRSHSHLYELKPMSRWLVVGFALICALGVYLNGASNISTWYLLFFGAMLGVAIVLAFPHILLVKPKD